MIRINQERVFKERSKYSIDTSTGFQDISKADILKNIEDFFGIRYFQDYENWDRCLYPVIQQGLHVSRPSQTLSGAMIDSSRKIGDIGGIRIKYSHMLYKLDKERMDSTVFDILSGRLPNKFIKDNI